MDKVQSALKLHITEGNVKIGRIPSVSLPPWETCDSEAPCRELCYARKAYSGYARDTAGPAWGDNLAYYKADPDGYFDAVVANLAKRRRIGTNRAYFRWHVGGDIPDPAYFKGMVKVARLLPGWQFLAYTRREYAWSTRLGYLEGAPSNLTVLRSLWLDEPYAYTYTPWFKVLDKGEPLPPGGVLCPGNCDKCYACWNLRPGEGRYIELH